MGVKPKALINRPRLDADSQFYLGAFYDLSAGRVIAEKPNPLPTSEILYYADRVLGMGPSDGQAKFLRLMRLLDATYLAQFS